MTKSRKGSQIGAGQGRKGLDIAHAYTCRVGGESTAVFPSPYWTRSELFVGVRL